MNSTSIPAKLIVAGMIDRFLNLVFIIPSVIAQFPVNTSYISYLKSPLLYPNPVDVFP